MDGFFNEDSWPEWPDDSKQQNVAAPAPPLCNNFAPEQNKPAAPINSHANYEDNFPALPSMAAQPAAKNVPPPQISSPGSQPPMGSLAWKKSPLGSRRSPYIRQKNLMQGPPSPASQDHSPVVPAPPMGGQEASFLESVPPLSNQPTNGTQATVTSYANQGHAPLVPAAPSGQGASFFDSVPPQQHLGTQPAVFPYGAPNNGPVNQLNHPASAPVFGLQQEQPPANPPGPAILPTSETVQQNEPSWFDGRNSGFKQSGGVPATTANEHSSAGGGNMNLLFGGMISGSEAGQGTFPASNEQHPADLPPVTSGGHGTASLFDNPSSSTGSQGGLLGLFPSANEASPAVLPPSNTDGHNAAAWFDSHNSKPQAQRTLHGMFPKSNEPPPAVLQPTTADESNAALWFVNDDSIPEIQGSDMGQMLPTSIEPTPAVLPTSSTHNHLNTASGFQTGEFASRDLHNHDMQSFDQQDLSQRNQLNPTSNGQEHGFLPSTSQGASSFFEAANPGSQAQLFGAVDMNPEVGKDIFTPVQAGMVQTPPAQSNPPFMPTASLGQSTEALFGISKPEPHVREKLPTPPAAVEESVLPTAQNNELQTLPAQDTPPAQSVNSQAASSGAAVIDQNASPWFVPGSTTELQKPAMFPPAPPATKLPPPQPSGREIFEPTKGPEPFHSSPQIFTPATASQLPPQPRASDLFEPTKPPNGPALFSNAQRSGVLPTQTGDVSRPFLGGLPEPTKPPDGAPLIYNPTVQQAAPVQPPLEAPPTGPLFPTSRSETGAPGPTPESVLRDTQSSNFGENVKSEPSGPPTGPLLFPTSGSQTREQGPTPVRAFHDTQPSNVGQNIKSELSGPPTGPQLFETSETPGETDPRQTAPIQLCHATTGLSNNAAKPPVGQHEASVPTVYGPVLHAANPGSPPVVYDQNVAASRSGNASHYSGTKSGSEDAVSTTAVKAAQPSRDSTARDVSQNQVLESLGVLRDSPTDTDIYEGSLQKQQKRQKEAAGAKAPLSSLWSTGPGAGTPWSSPLLTGPQQAVNKVNAPQIPLVGVLPLNVTQSPTQLPAPSPVAAAASQPSAASHASDAVGQQAQRDGKTPDAVHESEALPSPARDLELRAQPDRVQDDMLVEKSGTDFKTGISEPRERNVEDRGRNQEQREALESKQAPGSREQKSIPQRESLESLMEDSSRGVSRSKEPRTETAAPQDEPKGQTAHQQSNQDRQRAQGDEYREESRQASIPSRGYGESRAPYQREDQSKQRPHPEQYQDHEEPRVGHDGRRPRPEEYLEDSRAGYRKEDQDRRGPVTEQYQKHRDPRAAYQRERESPRAQEYQDYGDSRAVAHETDQDRRARPVAGEYQDYGDQRTAYQRDDQARGRAHPSEYQDRADSRAAYEREDQGRARSLPGEYDDRGVPSDAYQRDDSNRQRPHPGEYQEHGNYRQDAHGYGSHANEYRDYNTAADQYYQGYEDQRAAYSQHTPSGSGTPGSSGRNTPSQYYQQQWQGYYPYDPRYQQYYGGYYPGYSPYHQQYAQYYQQYYYPGQYGWGYSPSQSHSSYEGSHITADSMDGRESRERHHEEDAAVAYESPEPSVHEEEDEEAGRTTPLLYLTPTPVCKFTPSGKLLVVPPNQPLDGQMAAVKIAHAQVLFTPEEMKLMQDYPGPMTRETSKADVISYTDAMAEKCQLDQRTGAAIMWKVLGLLCKHSGSFVMPEVASLLSTFWKRPEPNATSAPEGEGGQDDEEDEAEPARDQVHDETTKLTMFREMMIVGSRKEALEYATRHHMWGHALLLASRLDARTYNNIVSRFLTTVSDEDPLRSLYQHLFCKLPAATRTGKDWVAHLATMIANPSSSPESDKGNIITLGDTLNTEGQTAAAHLCYLLAGCNIGKLTDPAAKVILLGHDHKKMKNEKLFPLECFQMTEIFEYAMRLKKQDDVFPALQMYKYLYCERLSEAGLYSQALHYLETMAMLIISSPNMFNDNLIKKVMQMSDHLAPYDTEQNYRVAGADESGPEWKEMLSKLIKARNDGSYVEDTGSDALGASQAASFFEGYEHQPSVPLYNTSQAQGGDGSSVPLYDTSQTQSGDGSTVPLYDTSQAQGGDGNTVPLYDTSQAQGGDGSSVPLYNPSQAPVDGQTFGPRDDNPVMNREDSSSTKSNSTTSFHPQSSWPNAYAPQDAPLTEPGGQYVSQASYPESYQSGGFEQQGQPPTQGDSFEFYQPPQQDPGAYGQQSQTFQPDPMDVPYQPPTYDPGQMTGQAAWATEPQGEPPSQGEPKPKADDTTTTNKSSPKQAAQPGWFSGISGLIKKVIPGGPNEMKLPDDKKKTIYYDDKLKRWVNTDEDEEEKAPPPPPPTDFQLGSPSSGPVQPTPPPSTTSQQTPGPFTNTPHMGPRHTGPATMATTPSAMGPDMGRSPLQPQGVTPSSPPSKFSRKAHSGGRGARAKYVDVFKSGASPAPIAPPSLFQVLPDAPPTGFFIPPAPDPTTAEGERKIGNPSSRPSSRAEDEVKRKTSRSSSHSSASGTSAEVESLMTSNHQEFQQQAPMFYDPTQMSNFPAPKKARNVRRY